MTMTHQRSPEEVFFLEVAARYYRAGVPMQELLDSAKEEQEKGGGGAYLKIEEDEGGPGAYVAVTEEYVDFKMGGVGPFVLRLETVQGLIAPPDIDF